MAKQDINIGVEGNDGTGDSIRESKKVNEKLYRTLCCIWCWWTN